MKIANPIDQTQSISANQQNQQKTKFHIIKTGLRNHQKKNTTTNTDQHDKRNNQKERQTSYVPDTNVQNKKINYCFYSR